MPVPDLVLSLPDLSRWGFTDKQKFTHHVSETCFEVPLLWGRSKLQRLMTAKPSPAAASDNASFPLYLFTTSIRAKMKPTLSLKLFTTHRRV